MPSGGDLRYRLTFGNRGVTSLAGGAARSPFLPGPRSCPRRTVCCRRPASSSGRSVRSPRGPAESRDLVVHVDAVAGQVLAGDATLSAGGAETRAPESGARRRVDSPLTVTLAAGPDPVGPGEPLLVFLTVANRGAAMVPGVQAALRVPREVAAIDPAAAGGPTCNLGASFGCDPLGAGTMDRRRSGAGAERDVQPSGDDAVRTGRYAAPVRSSSSRAEALATDGTRSGRAATTSRCAPVARSRWSSTRRPEPAAAEWRSSATRVVMAIAV